jgi:ribosomal protein L11 methyltransferase
VVVTRRVVQVDVPAGAAELAVDVLWQAGPSAVSEVDLGAGRVRLTADVADPARLDGLPAACEVTVLDLDGDAYLDVWRAWARPVRAGRHLVLHPAWLPLPAEGAPGTADDVTLLLDPGRAFGSGSHPTTRLVLGAIEALLAAGDEVLDAGTGSGVLAVAAARLGASAVVATDIDPAAVAATTANAAGNGVAGRIDVSTRPLATVPGEFDLVVANIGASVLRDLASDLAARVRPGGHLVLSGLLERQVDGVLERVPGFTEVERHTEDGWVAVVLRAPA